MDWNLKVTSHHNISCETLKSDAFIIVWKIFNGIRSGVRTFGKLMSYYDWNKWQVGILIVTSINVGKWARMIFSLQSQVWLMNLKTALDFAQCVDRWSENVSGKNGKHLVALVSHLSLVKGIIMDEKWLRRRKFA